MLSTRGATWATIDYARGKKDRYDPVTNPNSVVDMGNAENASMRAQSERVSVSVKTINLGLPARQQSKVGSQRHVNEA